MRTLLIDSDILAVASAASVEESYDFEDGQERAIAIGTEEDVAKQIKSRIDEYMSKLKATHFIICLSDQSRRYFRHDIYPPYKAHRTHGRTPVHLKFAKATVAAYGKVFERPGLEADDIMGILATHPKLVKGEKIIVSDDKDMGTVPSLWYRPRKDKLVCVDEDVANYTHMHQTITGDTVDGYPGRKGAGPKAANDALEGIDDPRERWKAVLSVYSNKIRGNPPPENPLEAAITQARVAKILTASDYDFVNKRPILWSPPHS